MRLVGASTLYIALPFLLEAVVTAAIGVALAGGALAAFMKYGVHDHMRTDLNFIPWVGLDEYVQSLIVIAVLGPLLTVIPTLVLTRKYLKV
jgi:cell division transport system permease protein